METINGMKRTAYCLDMLEIPLGTEVTAMGWCHKQRNLGGLVFITLRDRSGEIQLCVDENCSEELKTKAASVRGEYVLAARGILRERSSVNKNHPTGTIEIHLTELRILSEAKTVPFYIEENLEASEALRLTHRYLDLRRPNLQRNLRMRHKFTNCVHEYFNEKGFIEIETPMLGKSTPEGARDYLVPSRIFPGKFFALPQSPQLYKQLLMVAGCDRYLQISRCFRDEDLRADRQPEFTQVDLEMSFVDEQDVQDVMEGFMQKAFKDLLGQELVLPLPRMTYKEAISRFGSDKPDTRFGLELQDINAWADKLDFPPFCKKENKELNIQAIVVPKAAKFTRKELDSLAEYVKTYRARGLYWVAFDDNVRSSFLKFLDEEKLADIKSTLAINDGDLVLIIAEKLQVTQEALGHLRCELARRLNLVPENQHELIWITEFPLFEYDEEEGRLFAKHHPFTSPLEEDIEYLESDPARVRARAYDLVMNGTELGGGSVRIHDQALQEKMFACLGFSRERAYENFSFLLDAFQYGVPPHAGMAIGLDRAVMLFLGLKNIKEVIAFPKVQTSADLMTKAPVWQVPNN